jgi:hypothetical protein
MEMQGLTSMATKPTDHQKEILEDRKRRRLALQAEMKTLGKHKKRIKFRLAEGRDWPVTNTGDKADIDHDDVMAPLPEDMRAHLGDVDEKMQALRIEADQHQSFAGAVVPIDEGVFLRRRRDRDEERAATNAVRGEKWTPELVEARMEEAYRTLFRSAISGVRPREFGNGMPTPVRQMADMVAQAGNKSLRNAIAHRFKGVPSTEEVRRAEDALGWAMEYLADQHPDLSGFLQLGSMWKAWGAKITKKCADIGVPRQSFYRDRKEAVGLIVEGLIRDGKAPT